MSNLNVDRIRKETGQMIRIARIKKELQVKELASMVGLEADHLGKIERGKVPVRVEHIVPIAKRIEMRNSRTNT